ARNASALAHSEIAVAFATRWAHIRQLPAHVRAAAIAALKADQAAALSARIAYHVSRLLGEQRRDRLPCGSIARGAFRCSGISTRPSDNGRDGSSSGSNAENVRRCTGWGASRDGTPNCLSCGNKARATGGWGVRAG